MKDKVESRGDIAVNVSEKRPRALQEAVNGDLADVIVVGGGPAGLSCALILARANRKVHIFDSGDKRNQASEVQHAILGADGFNRATFIDQARDQITKYPTVHFHCKEVVDVVIAARDKDDGRSIPHVWGFKAITEDGKSWFSKKLVLATGVTDCIPDSLCEFWGRGVWVCLFCDGYEYNGQRLGAYGNGERGVHIALEMLLWSP